MPDLPPCNPDSNAARLMAAYDFYINKDNSQAVEDAFSPRNSLHYASLRSQMGHEHGQLYAGIGIDLSLESPYKEYFETPQGMDKGTDFKNETANVLMGNHPQYNVSRSRILGNDIVRPVEDAFRLYLKEMTGQRDAGALDEVLQATESKYHQNLELMDRLDEIKNDTGYADAINEAHDAIEEHYGDGQDEERYRFGKRWLSNLEDPRKQQMLYEKMFSGASQNIIKNEIHLQWVLSYRHFFDKMRAGYHFGWDNFQQGWKDWNIAKKLNDPELEKAGVRDSAIFTDHGLDILHPIVEQNKGVTYFAAKRAALQKGMSEEEAQTFGRNAIEQLQFQYSYVNKPEAMDGANTRSWLALMGFHLQQRRWFMDMYKQLYQGFKNREADGGKLFKNTAKVLGLYYLGNAAIFGPTADIPEEPARLMQWMFPKFYTAMRKADYFSLSGMMNIDLAELSRIPLTGLGVLTKVPLVFSKIGDLGDQWGRAVNHPKSVKNLVKLTEDGFMFVPGGFGRHLGNAVDLGYRLGAQDFDRYTYQGKKYETSAPEEIFNFLRGGKESFQRGIQKQELNANAS